MLDEKDLQAIAQLMDSKMAQQKKEIISETMVLMEAYFDPKFQALSEQINPVPKDVYGLFRDILIDNSDTFSYN